MEKGILSNPKLIVDIIGWDVDNWRPTLNYWDTMLDKKEGGKVLEIGAGQGGVSLFVAMNGYDVVCSDIDNPEDRVSTLHKKYNPEGSITYEAINALNVPYEDHFDFVIFKSVIGGIARDGSDEKRTFVMEQIYKSLKPGGHLLFAENLISSPLHKFLRNYFIKWGGNWNYATPTNMKSAMSMFSEIDYFTNGFLGAFGRTEFQRSLLSKMDRLLVEKIVFKSWHYIMYGSAKKD